MAKSLEEYSPEEISAMAAQYQELLEHPETREFTLRATKRINPKLSIPELEIKDQTRAAQAGLDKRMTSLEDGIRTRDAENRVLRERATLHEQGFSTDEVAAVEKIMMDEQIPSYATAAKYYRASTRVAEPAPYGAGGRTAQNFSLPGDALAAAMKGGNKAVSAYARDQATQALNEIRSGQIKVH